MKKLKDKLETEKRYFQNSPQYIGSHTYIYRKTNEGVKEQARSTDRQFTKEKIQMVNKHVRICSCLPVIREV